MKMMTNEQIILVLEEVCTALEGHDDLKLLPLLRPAINKIDNYIMEAYPDDVGLAAAQFRARNAFHEAFKYNF